MQAPFRKLLNFDRLYDSQEYKSFEIHAVIIKISTIRSLVYFHFFEALNNGGFEVQFFQGFIFTP